MRGIDLNYQHLRYFHAVAREGSVQQAARMLHLAPSTVSSQLRRLEEALGKELFQRTGRNLVLTAFGRTVQRYTDGIFGIGDELARAVAHEGREPLRVGVSSVLPKLLVRHVLQPALSDEVELIVQHGPAEELLGALATRKLDVVLSDGRLPEWVAVQGTSHLVVETDVAIFGTSELAEKAGEPLPQSLGAVPWLVPPAGTSLRRALEHWWEEVGIEPDIAAVVDDSALLKALGESGVGVFAAPQSVQDAILFNYDVVVIGVTKKVVERTYAITREREPSRAEIRRLLGLL